MDNSVKSSLRNFNDIKYRQDGACLVDTANLNLQLSRIGKMMEDSVVKFTRRYLIISTELEEMKREFIGQASLVNEFVNLTKREIRLDKFDKYPMKAYTNTPACPIFEQRCLKKDSKITSTRPKKDLEMNTMRTNKSIARGTKTSQQNKNASLYSPTSVNPNMNNVNSNPNQYPTNENKFLGKSIMKHFIQGKTEPKRDRERERDIDKDSNSNFNHSKTKEQPTLQGLSSKEKEEYHSKVLESIDDEFFKAIYILANSSILPIEDRMKLCSLNREISSKVIPSEIINDSLTVLQSRMKKLEKIKDDTSDSDKKIIDKLCSYPSKTAKTGLNFLTSERESELIQQDTEVNIQLIKMIYACLEEEPEFATVSEGYDTLFDKYNVNSIKSLFSEVIYKRIFIDNIGRNDYNKEKIIEEIQTNNELITNSLVNNTNKTFSYVAFSLEEIEQHLKNLDKIGMVTVSKIKNELELRELKNQFDLLCSKMR